MWLSVGGQQCSSADMLVGALVGALVEAMVDSRALAAYGPRQYLPNCGSLVRLLFIVIRAVTT